MTEPKLWEIVIELPTGDRREVFEEALSDFVTGQAVFEIDGTPRWRLTGYAEVAPHNRGENVLDAMALRETHYYHCHRASCA